MAPHIDDDTFTWYVYKSFFKFLLFWKISFELNLKLKIYQFLFPNLIRFAIRISKHGNFIVKKWLDLLESETEWYRKVLWLARIKYQSRVSPRLISECHASRPRLFYRPQVKQVLSHRLINRLFRVYTRCLFWRLISPVKGKPYVTTCCRLIRRVRGCRDLVNNSQCLAFHSRPIEGLGRVYQRCLHLVRLNKLVWAAIKRQNGSAL